MIRANNASRICRRWVHRKQANVRLQRSLGNQQLVVGEHDLKGAFSSIINSPTKSVHISLSRHLDQLSRILLDGHTASTQAWEEPLLIVKLMELVECGVEEVEEQARLCLALLGQAPSYPGSGLRILSIDGGGTRGLLPITILKYLEELCGQPVHKLFDFVCGTSTGSLLAAILCLEKLSAEETRRVYLNLSSEVFKMNNLLGMSQLFLNHAFYDSKLLQKHIRQFKSVNVPMYKTSSHPGVPRLCFVTTVANQPVVAPYLFCNYQHRPSQVLEKRNHYQQMCAVECWEAIMASTAAPGFFEEVKLGPYVFMDGGILTNNPCGVAVHEARLLWGSSVPIQTVVSLGTGLKYKSNSHQPTQEHITSTSFREKVINVVGGATDTETVHMILNDVYHPSAYFRFQPELSEDFGIDESKPEKLSLLCQDAERFIAEHKDSLEAAAHSLQGRKTLHQKVQGWFTINWDKITHSFQYNSRKFRDRF